ncbi:sporulation protein [Clostridium polyendosporum]|uniref:Sporulation protein n=1 Tax=Clostridium polyendosporum TaxID=69208 RepID=A0A919VFH0_9CLOT|nr:sporulation membrane protein YtaF [Clostridium polyendosporum]GIM28142.1 sporulation protein [Clostridium polyendosporum]
MNVLAVLLFVLTSGIDALTVSIAYGMKKIKIGILSNIVIGTISTLGTFLSMSLGYIITKFISETIANILGNTILLGIGIWFLFDYYSSKQSRQAKNHPPESCPSCIEILEKPEKADLDHSGSIDLRESLCLSIALTINNIGLGIGASILGLNITLTTLLTFIFSIVVIPLGMLFGRSILSKVFENSTSLISGLIIIILSMYEIISKLVY